MFYWEFQYLFEFKIGEMLNFSGVRKYNYFLTEKLKF